MVEMPLECGADPNQRMVVAWWRDSIEDTALTIALQTETCRSYYRSFMAVAARRRPRGAARRTTLGHYIFEHRLSTQEEAGARSMQPFNFVDALRSVSTIIILLINMVN